MVKCLEELEVYLEVYFKKVMYGRCFEDFFKLMFIFWINLNCVKLILCLKEFLWEFV